MEGHDLEDVPSCCDRQTAGAGTRFVLVALSIYVKARHDNLSISIPAITVLAAGAHHQFHLSEFVELSPLFYLLQIGKQKFAEKSKDFFHFSPLTH